MSYVANEYNYCTPLDSVSSLTNDTAAIQDIKYFTLFDNSLDGSYRPISDDVGLWGASVADQNGALPTSLVVTVTTTAIVRYIRITGSTYSYPVDFVVRLYNGSTLLDTETITGNTLVERTVDFPSTFSITSYTVTVSAISRGGAVARLYNVNAPFIIEVHSTDTIYSGLVDASSVGIPKQSMDALHITSLDETTDRRYTIHSGATVPCVLQEASVVTNIHTIMRRASRQTFGKVYITYTDPMLENEAIVTTSSTAYNSRTDQLMSREAQRLDNTFTLYANDLTGAYKLSDKYTQVGWSSALLSGLDGRFTVAPWLLISFFARPIMSLDLLFAGSIAVDFDVTFTDATGNSSTRSIVNNTSTRVPLIEEPMQNIVSIKVLIYRINRAGYPAQILGLPVVATVEYVGYADKSDLVSIDLLEELSYRDDIEALGGMSANEVTVMLDNSSKEFYFNNQNSLVASQLKRNRKIVPWLGAEVVPGQIEWYQLGVFWAYNWTVPFGSLTATVVGFDTIGLLSTVPFTTGQTQVSKSLGYLIEYVLSSAKQTLSFLDWSIDAALYNIVIPYAWFNNESYAAALRRLSECYAMHIYCDRHGRIIAAPQKLAPGYHYDKWSDSDTVIAKDYSSLYTTLPNIINVSVVPVYPVADMQLVSDQTVFNVANMPTRVLLFSAPYLSNALVTVDCDATVSFTYTAYSWGLTVNFTGTGCVRHISCTGTALVMRSTDTATVSDGTVQLGGTDLSPSIITMRDETSILLNGAVTRDISSDFIQTAEHATQLLDRISSLSAYDRYDVTVDYRGDIALSINDPVLLVDGIAPTNTYNIKRHKLFWNGSLTGSADLNT